MMKFIDKFDFNHHIIGYTSTKSLNHDTRSSRTGETVNLILSF
jgi:hypothetical protein